MSKVKSKINNKGSDAIKNSAVINPITNDANLLSYYTNTSTYDENEIFDKSYSQALELMCGDKLLKSASTINSVIVRKTATEGLYKLILNNPDSNYKIEHIYETELVNNRAYCMGTVSKLGEDKYEVTYFDDDDEIVIEYYSKEEVIDFMNKNKLVFQN